MQNTSFLGLNKPEYTDFADVAVLNQNADMIDAALASEYTFPLPVSGWSGSAPYTQTVTVTGLSGSAKPIVLLDTSASTSLANERAMKKQFGLISFYDTTDDHITFTAKHQAPNMTLNIVLKGV